MKAKTTKRALLTSALSLLLCISMLVGTTFAWFTDSVQSGINKIVAGMNDGSLDNSIVLMHETYTSTAEAVEYLAPYMKQQGWQIVTVSELFKANGKVMYDGQIYGNAR